MPIIPFKKPENREYRSIIDSVINRLNILEEYVSMWALQLENPELYNEIEDGDHETWVSFYKTYKEQVLTSDNKDIQVIARLYNIIENSKANLLQHCRFAPNNYDDDLPDYLM